MRSQSYLRQTFQIPFLFGKYCPDSFSHHISRSKSLGMISWICDLRFWLLILIFRIGMHCCLFIWCSHLSIQYCCIFLTYLVPILVIWCLKNIFVTIMILLLLLLVFYQYFYFTIKLIGKCYFQCFSVIQYQNDSCNNLYSMSAYLVLILLSSDFIRIFSKFQTNWQTFKEMQPNYTFWQK